MHFNRYILIEAKVKAMRPWRIKATIATDWMKTIEFIMSSRHYYTRSVWTDDTSVPTIDRC